MRLLLAAALVFASTASAAPGDAAAPRDPIAERIAGLGAALARDRTGPAAAADLAELRELEAEAPDLARLATLYGRVAEDAGALPEVRAFARRRLAAVERARGNLQRHAAQLRLLGFLGDWRVIGPFDDEGKRGFDAVQPPERAIELDAVYPGKGGDAAWRAVPPEAIDSGFVHVGAVLAREKEACAHALAVVALPRDERLALWLGASGAARVVVNGAVAIEDRAYHEARPDQRGAEVTLRRGANRILVKVCGQEGSLGFYLRLVDRRGSAREVVPVTAVPLPPPPAAGPAPAPLASVVERLERRAEAAARGKGPGAAEAEADARLDLARAIDALQPFDAAERRALAAARRAVELSLRRVDVRLLAARLEPEENGRRSHLEAASAAAPDDPRVLLALAREELARERPLAAVRLLGRAVGAAPGYGAARAWEAAALERAGFDGRGARAAEEAAAQLPTSPAAVMAAARAARGMGRSETAAWLLRKAIALRFDAAEARDTLVQLLVDRGDVDGAVALAAEGLRVRPGRLDAVLRLADLLAANGRTEEAEARFADGLRLGPESADAWERRGRARLRAGREADALADLQHALALEPQRPALKELVRGLEPKREPFEAPYVLDAEALAKRDGDGAPDDDAVILGELQVTRLQPSGLSSSYEQLVVRIRTQRGAEVFRRRAISYAPGRQEVKVVRVRVLKPDGTRVDAWEEDESMESEPWYRLYYDTRARTLLVPSLAAGDVLELAWRVDDTARENLLGDYYGDLSVVDGPYPNRRFDHVLLAPASRPIFDNAPAGVRRTDRPLAGGLVEHRWTVEGLKRVEPEPMMPGFTETGRFLHVSTFASWADVGRFYWGLVRDPLRVTPEIQATADRLAGAALGARARAAAGERTPAETEALVEAVYGFVVTQVRYVGLEFGIHGYQPYRVDQVLQRRFGDCKDKASLMHALLEALGVDSRLVLLRMRRLGALPEAPASLSAFNHAILYVPSLDRWLDGTAAYTGSHELPGEDRGASVLVVEPDGPPRFGRIPEASAGDNLVTSEFAVALAADGTARIDGRSAVTGAQAAGYRRTYETSSDRRAVLERSFGRVWPGVRVESVETGPLARIEEPVALRFRLAAPGYAQREGAGLRFSPFGTQRRYSETWAGLNRRSQDLVVGEPMETRIGYRVALPAGFEVAELPEPASGAGAWGSYEVRYRVEGGAIVADGRFTLLVARIPAAAYAEFRAFAAAADAAFARTVRVEPRAAKEAGR